MSVLANLNDMLKTVDGFVVSEADVPGQISIDVGGKFLPTVQAHVYVMGENAGVYCIVRPIEEFPIEKAIEHFNATRPVVGVSILGGQLAVTNRIFPPYSVEQVEANVRFVTSTVDDLFRQFAGGNAAPAKMGYGSKKSQVSPE